VQQHEVGRPVAPFAQDPQARLPGLPAREPRPYQKSCSHDKPAPPIHEFLDDLLRCRGQGLFQDFVLWIGLEAAFEHVACLGVFARLAMEIAEGQVDLGLGDARGLLVEAL